MITVRDAAFDYWRLGLDLQRPGLADRYYVLLDRYVLPLIGHMDVEAVSELHIEAIALVLGLQEIDERITAHTIRSLRLAVALARAPLSRGVTRHNGGA